MTPCFSPDQDGAFLSACRSDRFLVVGDIHRAGGRVREPLQHRQHLDKNKHFWVHSRRDDWWCSDRQRCCERSMEDRETPAEERTTTEAPINDDEDQTGPSGSTFQSKEPTNAHTDKSYGAVIPRRPLVCSSWAFLDSNWSYAAWADGQTGEGVGKSCKVQGSGVVVGDNLQLSGRRGE